MKQTSPFLSIFFEPYVINSKDKSLRNRVAIPVFQVIHALHISFSRPIISVSQRSKIIYFLDNHHVFNLLFYPPNRPAAPLLPP